MVKFEKRPGLDWIVDVLIISENEVYPTTVFGAADEAEARREALSSFSMRIANDLRVLRVTMLDLP